MIILRADEKLQEWCQKFSHWLQDWTGWTNFTIVRVGLILQMGSIALDFPKRFWPALFPYHHTWVLIPLGLWFIWDIILWKALRHHEETLFQGDAVKEQFDKRDKLFSKALWGSMFLITLTVAFVVGHKTYPSFILGFVDIFGVQIGELLWLYFIDCIPRRPGRTKIGEKIRSLFTVQQPVSVGARG